MTDPALFVINRSGRVEVMLGKWLVGIIEPWADLHGHSVLGRVNAYYWLTMPFDGAPMAKKAAPSTRVARRLLLHRLAEWFEAAGPVFAPIAETLAAQAELEREVV